MLLNNVDAWCRARLICSHPHVRSWLRTCRILYALARTSCSIIARGVWSLDVNKFAFFVQCYRCQYLARQHLNVWTQALIVH
jgi:hypothetical protein